MVDAAIIGAGISGLVAAHELRKQGLSVALFERDTVCGGQIRTHREGGLELELGPNSLLLRESARPLLEELRLLPIELPKEMRTRFLSLPVRGSEKVVPLRMSRGHLPQILSLRGRLRCALEPFVSRTLAVDESVAEFIARHFGSEVAARIAAPFFNGVYAADIRQLSARSALNTLWELEEQYRSILFGLLRKPRTPRPKMVSFPGGMSSLVEALVSSVLESLHTGIEIQSLQVTSEGVEITHSAGQMSARRVFLSPDAPSTAKLIAVLDPPLAEKIANIPYAPVGILHLLGEVDQLDRRYSGIGFLRTPQDGEALLGALFTSLTWPGSAPPGKLLLTCFLGGRMNPGLSDAKNPETQQLAIRRLRGLLSIQGKLEVVHAHTWKNAIPNYPVGHGAVETGVRDFERRYLQIKFIGNWIKQPGVADCIERGLAAARP